MFLIIAGGIIVGAVGLGAIYDFVGRRHGRNVSVSSSGPLDGQSFSVDQAASLVHDHDFQHG
jgi:hypothetical protein